jgi:hypothetical protein
MSIPINLMAAQSRLELLVAEAAEQTRYDFGTTEDEASGERNCKRRFANHLGFLPVFVEGRSPI